MRDFSDPAQLESEWGAGIDAIKTPVRTPLISHGLAPHSLYACSDEILQRCAETVEKIGCHLQIHIAETLLEVSESLQKHKRTPVERLDELGLLGPHTLMAHGVWMNETDCARAAKAGATVSHNVTSNMKLASGIAPLVRFRSAGLSVALGTDSAASNNVLDPFREMKFALLAQRASTGDAAAFTPRMALEAATRSGAHALGMADEIGSLEPGKRADIILIDLDKPHFAPTRLNDADALATAIVFCAGASDVDTVIVGGRMIMRNRGVFTLEAHVVLESARTASQRMLSRANR
jgi:5-methylthioadenosine/S-adenosylhomocysteine deaminase